MKKYLKENIHKSYNNSDEISRLVMI